MQLVSTIAVKGASFYAYHGYFEEERYYGNEYLVDLEVEFLTKPELTIQLIDTVNYQELYDICKEQMDISRHLLESVAQDIIGRVAQRWHYLSRITVKIEKLQPQLGGKVESTVVKMSHEKTNE